LKWRDAIVDGLELKGFQLEETWDQPELTWILAITMIICIVISAISTAISRNWQTGLAAGSLVVTLAAFIVGAITLYDKISLVRT
jgi:hypothetical protein